MKNITFIALTMFTACCMLITSCGEPIPQQTENLTNMYKKMTIEPPVAAKKPKELIAHGDTRIDNYYWLNQREDQEVLDYLNAENKYKDAILAGLKDVREELFEEMKGRIKEQDETVPYKENGYWYYTRYEEGKEYPIYCRKKGSQKAAEEIILNVNILAEGQDYYNARSLQVSTNNKILAYGEDTLSRRIYKIVFKNLETGEMLEDEIPNTSGSIVWANDNKTIFYGIKDETLRVFKIMKHRLGTDAANDEVAYHETDPTFNLGIGKTKSKKYIIIGSSHTLYDEYRYMDADRPAGNWTVFQPRIRDLEYSIDHAGGKWYIRTNLDAKNFRLMAAEEGKTNKENWTELIPHNEDVFFQDMDIFKNYLVLSERVKGIRNIRIKPLDGSADHFIDFGEDSFVSYVAYNPEYNTDVVRIMYQSMTTPSTTYDYDIPNKKLKLLKEQEVLGGFDKNNYRSERIYATVRDGVKVPISIVYKKGFKKDGKQPLLLYGYGSYGYSIEPSFRSTRLSLLDRGFAYAIAHIRGGQEMGRQWYEDGKLLKKKNTFNDFVDCGEYLIDKNYTGKDNLFAMGGSAGGLLMGAVVNMRPDLFKGVVAAVPFVDVVTTMLDETIPLTTFEWDEWGDPHKKEYYNYMLSYSPYDQVMEKNYPAMLVTTGLHDSQVQYWEPAKWVAKLRDKKVGNNPLLLHINMETGHGGASGRFEALKETAMEYAFMLDLAGKVKVKG
ncbi:MAG TPA: S9 family peptidase [Bacteroidetes bacterium]|nr:S9 family peptidase [Bacteroidota bacterium]